MKGDKKDLGFIDDALDLIADASCAETHLARSYSELKDEDILELMVELRRDRSELLYKLVKENSSEIYCIVKHLSKVSRNFEELANRLMESKEEKLAKEYLEKSRIYKNVCKLLLEKGM